MSENFQLTTPVVFMVFNRPSKTRLVFEAIAKAKPTKLLVIADGPRSDRSDDQIKCQEVREIIDNGMNWECEVIKNYAPQNMGCKNRISSGLDWVFKNVEEAIILEDDCLPDQSFFPFCQELLKKYAHDQRIMHIGGFNIAANNKRPTCSESYFFSQVGLICGWATWRRAWQYYDVNISSWPEAKQSNMLGGIFSDKAVISHYESLFDQYYNRLVDSWDSQWLLIRWIQKGLSITPKTNLVTNIGFDTDAAHKAIDPNDERAHVPVIPMTFPLTHPASQIVDSRADAYTLKHYMDINHYWPQRWRWFIKLHLPWVYRFLKKTVKPT